jgi:hypothetical protein
MRLEDGTMVCCFDLKKSRKSFRTWLLGRICELVIMAKLDWAGSSRCDDRTAQRAIPTKFRQEISPKPPGNASWKFIGCKIALPVVEAKGGNGPAGYGIKSHGVFTPLRLALTEVRF